MYYHGTSSNINIEDGILLPSTNTNILREKRNKYLDSVFVTDSLKSAIMYANKAVNKFNGYPIVYRVTPDDETILYKGNHEYICDYAYIDGVVDVR